MSARPSIAVLVPCLNEAQTVGRVVREFREQLPEARVYVFDNGSSDRTIEEAREAGAEVFVEPRRGKGFVVQTMFRRVDAAVYVMVDGDAACGRLGRVRAARDRARGRRARAAHDRAPDGSAG